MFGAAHGGEESVLFGANVRGQILFPGEVPFLLVTSGDGVAIHCRLEVWRNNAARINK